MMLIRPLLFLVAVTPAAASAADPPDSSILPSAPFTADEVMKRYHDQVSALMRGAGCRAASAAEEIVVCGRVSSQRGDFPREPGEIVRHINEPGSGMAALSAGGCDRLCNVGVKVNLLQAITGAPRAFRRLLRKD